MERDKMKISEFALTEDEISEALNGTNIFLETFCRVCGDKASGVHYGVESCEGCKGFYRRTTRQGLQYPQCSTSGKCEVNRSTRNRCQSCRYEKCVRVGMSRDAVKFGRIPKKEKETKIAERVAEWRKRNQSGKLRTSVLERTGIPSIESANCIPLKKRKPRRSDPGPSVVTSQNGTDICYRDHELREAADSIAPTRNTIKMCRKPSFENPDKQHFRKCKSADWIKFETSFNEISMQASQSYRFCHSSRDISSSVKTSAQFSDQFIDLKKRCNGTFRVSQLDDNRDVREREALSSSSFDSNEYASRSLSVLQLEEFKSSLVDMTETLHKAFRRTLGIHFPPPQTSCQETPIQRTSHLSFDPTVQATVSFAKSIPGFSSLTSSDQVTLLKSAASEVFLVLKAVNFPSGENFSNLHHIFSQLRLINEESFIRAVTNFSQKIASIDLKSGELALFVALVIASNDRVGLRDSEKVQGIRNQLLLALSNKLEVTKGIQRLLTYSNLLLLLSELRTLGYLTAFCSFEAQSP